MKPYRWNHEKNLLLKTEHGISFEEIVLAIEAGGFLGRVNHPNAARYPNQSMLIVAMAHYVYLVPYVEETEFIF